MPNHQCPKCGGEGKCFFRYADTRKDYYDEYIFVCNSCVYTEKVKKWAGSPITWERPTYCPFCEKSSDQHIVFSAENHLTSTKKLQLI